MCSRMSSGFFHAMAALFGGLDFMSVIALNAEYNTIASINAASGDGIISALSDRQMRVPRRWRRWHASECGPCEQGGLSSPVR